MSDVQFLQKDGVLHITLSVPDKGNALSSAIVEPIIERLESINYKSEKALVILGEGRHFCTGFDLSDLEQVSDGDLLQRFVRIEHMLQLIRHASIPTIAFTQGAAYGAGADIFAACQFRFAAERAKFAFPGPNFGLILGTNRLSHLIGADTALTIIGGNKPIDCNKAVSVGLVTQCIEADDLDDCITSACSSFSPSVNAALRQAAIPDTRDSDMSALVHSAFKPGLKERIVSYRASLQKKSKL